MRDEEGMLEKDGRTRQAPIASGFGKRSTARDVMAGRDLKGYTAIVTGGYSGIGLETTRALAKAGAAVVVPARSPDKARRAIGNRRGVEFETMELTDPASIDAFAARFIASGRPLHLLINNAGIMATPLMRDSRGYEAQFATNHLGHYQLTARLWPALKQAGGARVVAVSSRAQRLGGVRFDDPNFETTPYDKWLAYAQSKSANILFAVELDRLVRPHGVRAYAVHPGLIPSTGIGRYGRPGAASAVLMRAGAYTADKLDLYRLLNWAKKPARGDHLKTIRQGAATTLWCATNEALEGRGGVYCEDCDIGDAVPADSKAGYGVRPWAIDPEAAGRLWRLSEELTGVSFEG